MESETFSEIGSDCTPPERKFNVYGSVREIKEVKYNNYKSWKQKV